MTLTRNLIAAFALIFTCCGVLFASPAQNRPTPDLTLKDGVLRMSAADGDILTDVKLRVRIGDGTPLTGELRLIGRDEDRDKAGAFQRSRYRLNLDAASLKAQTQTVNAVLDLRYYPARGVTTGALDYKGPALAMSDGVQLQMRLAAYARGMASKRFKLYWGAPVFTSDFRYLPTSNQLLLWRRMQGDDYHLLVPLAGDGMVADIGVSDINYRYEFRVSASSLARDHTPRRVPLFAYAASGDPYELPRDAYETVFTAGDQYGRLRWDKSYPEMFRSLGWCSWNTYYKEVTADKVINSVRSLRDRKISVNFVLVDDGWLDVKENKLAGFEGDRRKFPRGMQALARTLRDEYKIPHVGVWHTFQGYWDGVHSDSDIAKRHKIFTGIDGKSLPDPRGQAGASFYQDWYSQLSSWGYDFVKIDNQSSNGKFTDGLIPLFTSGGGTQRNIQEAALKHFVSPAEGDARPPGLNVISCMEMTLENSFNWRYSNIARNSDDYLPEDSQNVKEHIYQNAYNAFWTSSFAYPDWDMFQSHDPRAENHAVARAISGGPVYFTDEPGKENVELLRRLVFSDGRLLMPDAPGQVTRDLLLTDPALEAVPLKIFSTVTRSGYTAGTVAAFNVNKSAERVVGRLAATDIEGLKSANNNPPARVAVYRRGDSRVTLLDAANPTTPLTLDEYGFDLFTMVPVERGVAVFGLLDKFIGAAGVESVSFESERIAVVRLREAGDFGAWLAASPARVEIDGRALPSTAYSYAGGLLRIPHASFGDRAGGREVRLRLS